MKQLLLFLCLLGASAITLAQVDSSTVTVGARASLPDQPGTPTGFEPPVDSGLDLSNAAFIEVEVFGFERPNPNLPPNFPNSGAFVASFFDATGNTIALDPDTYPIPVLCEVPTNPGPSPCTMFQPIPTGSPPAVDDCEPALDVFVSPPLPVPEGAVAIQYGHFDTLYGDNDGFMTVTTRIMPIPVAIDIKPDDEENCVKIDGKGFIPVAIFGTASFDVTEIDETTLTLDGAEVRMRANQGPACSVEDVNADPHPDLKCHFIDDGFENWVEGETTATLAGGLFDGTLIEGSDTICIRRKKEKKDKDK